jgi:hypothetical protein
VVVSRPEPSARRYEVTAAKRSLATCDKLSSMYCVRFQSPPPRQFKHVFMLFMASLAQFSSGMAGANPPVVTGYTSASTKSVEGIRNLLVLLVCPQLQSIVAESPPNGFDPRVPPELPTTLVKRPVGAIRFEQWAVTGCGRTGQFLIQLWYDASGDEQYSASPPNGWLDANADVLTIRISEDGICHVLDDSMPCDQLRQYLLTKHLAQNGRVHIAVDQTSKYELVAATLESLQGLGLKIGFVNNDASASR